MLCGTQDGMVFKSVVGLCSQALWNSPEFEMGLPTMTLGRFISKIPVPHLYHTRL